MRKRLLTTAIALMTGYIAILAQTPVEKHGQLTVNKTQLTNCHGQPVQLRGVSMGWHNLWPRFYNRSTVTTLAKDWKVDIVRCSIGVSLDSLCYDKKPELAYNCVDSIVQGAVENGIYAGGFPQSSEQSGAGKEVFRPCNKEIREATKPADGDMERANGSGMG